MEDNISSVFGSKFLSTLLPLTVNVEDDMAVPSDAVDDSPSRKEAAREGDEENESSSACQETLRCVGFVSKPREGVGRSDSDRQYVFCNGRPVEVPRIHRLFNEVREYTCHENVAELYTAYTRAIIVDRGLIVFY